MKKLAGRPLEAWHVLVDGLGRRLDAADIDLFELFNVFEDLGNLRLELRDDGDGFKVKARHDGFGWRSIGV